MWQRLHVLQLQGNIGHVARKLRGAVKKISPALGLGVFALAAPCVLGA